MMRVLDFNHCRISKCKCGWNLTIGGTSDKELKKLKKILLENFEMIDYVNYSNKLSTEKFLDR